jgi:hypothetical protein
MSAAFPHQNESKQSDLTAPGQPERPVQAGWARRWTAVLGVITAPFTSRRGVLGSTGQAGWATRLTAIVGLVVALLGIPEGVAKLLEFVHPYELEISAGKDLTISYRPQQEVVEFVFNVQAEEFGSKPNQIVSARAWIEQALTSRVLLNISRPQFEENALRKYEPVIPAGPSPRNLQCSIAFRLDDRSREVFQSVGLRRLVIEFKGKDNQMHQVPFCFNIEDVGIDRLFNSPEKQFRYISEDPLCPDDKP